MIKKEIKNTADSRACCQGPIDIHQTANPSHWLPQGRLCRTLMGALMEILDPLLEIIHTFPSIIF